MKAPQIIDDGDARTQLVGYHFLFPFKRYKPQPLLVWFPVAVLEKRAGFGRIDVRVQPVGGEGKMWVSAMKLGPWVSSAVSLL